MTANAKEHLRMSGDDLVIIANWWRIAYGSPFATIFANVRTVLREEKSTLRYLNEKKELALMKISWKFVEFIKE